MCNNVIEELAKWANKSQGHPIAFPSGTRYIWIEKVFNASEIASIESTWQISLPVSYRQLLTHVGAGRYFVEPTRGKSVPTSGIEFKRIDDVCTTMFASTAPAVEREIGGFLPIGKDWREGVVLILGLTPSAPIYGVAALPKKWNQIRLSERDYLGTFADWLQRIADTYLRPHVD